MRKFLRIFSHRACERAQGTLLSDSRVTVPYLCDGVVLKYMDIMHTILPRVGEKRSQDVLAV